MTLTVEVDGAATVTDHEDYTEARETVDEIAEGHELCALVGFVGNDTTEGRLVDQADRVAGYWMIERDS